MSVFLRYNRTCFIKDMEVDIRNARGDCVCGNIESIKIDVGLLEVVNGELLCDAFKKDPFFFDKNIILRCKIGKTYMPYLLNNSQYYHVEGIVEDRPINGRCLVIDEAIGGDNYDLGSVRVNKHSFQSWIDKGYNAEVKNKNYKINEFIWDPIKIIYVCECGLDGDSDDEAYCSAEWELDFNDKSYWMVVEDNV